MNAPWVHAELLAPWPSNSDWVILAWDDKERCILKRVLFFCGLSHRLDVNKKCIKSKEGIIIHFNILNDMRKPTKICQSIMIWLKSRLYCWTFHVDTANKRDSLLLWYMSRKITRSCLWRHFHFLFPCPVTLLMDYYVYTMNKQLEILFWDENISLVFWGLDFQSVAY